MNSNNQSSNKEPQQQLQDRCLTCDKCTCGSHCGDARCNLECTDWLADVPGVAATTDIVEVHFKNTRKGFFRNSAHIPLKVGDMVAVEATIGHDIGRVSMMGPLVRKQIKKANLKPGTQLLRVFRKAKPADIERYEQAKAKEVDTMIRSRKIAADLHLQMKIGDVEYQGDGNKAIFYYIADKRVDFRQLIKVLADVFKIRVEMKQIGARQEAGRIGGIGPCGRPLCCASWMTNFVSVATSAARFQNVSLNPQKLAGQCAKLKCCINFEVDAYVEASRKMPPRDVPLLTKDKTYYHFKTDLLNREISYSTEKSVAANVVTLTPERVREVLEMNRNGEKPDSLLPEGDEAKKGSKAFVDLLGQDSISRFDKKKKKKKNKSKDKDKGAKPQAAAQPKELGNADKKKGGDKKPAADKAPAAKSARKPQQQGSQPKKGEGGEPRQGGQSRRRGRQGRAGRQPNPKPDGGKEASGNKNASEPAKPQQPNQ